jgi:hypothetical protein
LHIFITSPIDTDHKIDVMCSIVHSGPFINDTEKFGSFIADVLVIDELRVSLLQHTLELQKEPQLIEVIYKALCISLDSSYIRKKVKELSILDIALELLKTNTLRTERAFEMCAALSGNRFDPSFDRAVYNFVKSGNLESQPFQTCLRLVFCEDITGRRRLVFPSLLYLCGDFELHSPYDVWVAGQHGLAEWLKQTGKTIDKFPAIKTVAKRFLLPEHAKMLFEFPKLFEECCADEFGLIPLIEFQRGTKNAELTIQTASKSNAFTMSFWFFVKHLPQQHQLCAILNSSISISGDELFFGETFVGLIQINRWYSVIVSSDRQKATVYFNGKVALNCICSFNPTVVFGAGTAQATWFIGGAIRIISEYVQEDAAMSIVNAGVSKIAKFLPNERLTMTADSFLEHFKASSNHESLAEATCPVPSFPLMMHVEHAYRGGAGIFERILKKIADGDIEDSKTFARALCRIHALGCSSWKDGEFALQMSSLFNIAPNIFDSALVGDVLAVLAPDSRESICWADLMIFLLDPGLFNASFNSFLISRVFAIFVQFPIDDLNLANIFFVFVFSFLQLCLIDDADKNVLMALLSRLRPSPHVILGCFCSLSGDGHGFKFESIGNDSKYHEFIPMMRNSLKSEAVFGFLFRVLAEDDALDFIFDCIRSKKIENKHFVMRICIELCHLPRSWSIAISLLTLTVIDVTKTLDLDGGKLDAAVMPQFLVMVSILLAASYSLSKESFWTKLLASILSLLQTIAAIIPLRFVDNKFQFGVSLLLSSGLFTNASTLFPFAPSQPDMNSFVSISMSRDQEFTQYVSDEIFVPPFPLAPLKDSNIDAVYAALHNIVPDSVPFIPPHNSVTVTTTVFRTNFADCERALHANYAQVYGSWRDFFLKQTFKFGCESIADPNAADHSLPTLDVIQFFSKLLVRSLSDPLFKSLLNILLMPTNVDRNHCIFVMQKTVFMVLQSLNDENIFSIEFCGYVCDRIREGWFQGTVIPPLSILVESCIKCDRPIPDVLLHTVFLCFDIIPHDQFPILNELASTVFNATPSSFVILCGKVFENVGHTPVLSNTLSLFGQTDEEIQLVWGIEHCKVSVIAIGVQLAGSGLGFEEWQERHADDFGRFIDFYQGETMNVKDTIRKRLFLSLKEISAARTNLTDSHLKQAKSMIKRIQVDIGSSRAIASLAKAFHRDWMEFNLDCFMRVREQKLTRNQHFEPKTKTRRSLTILTDPLFPTRRIEDSPAVYKFPAFPSGTIEEAEPAPSPLDSLMPAWPISLQNRISIKYSNFEILGSLTDKMQLLSFSGSFAISEIARLAAMQCILNSGASFEHIQSVAFLYGVEPLSALVMRTKDSFFIVEGIQQTEKGVEDVIQPVQRLILRFYISYMATGHFGLKFLISGRVGVEIPNVEIIGAVKHLWMQQPIAVDIFTMSGWNFVLIAEDFPRLFAALQSVVEKTLHEMAPGPGPASRLRSQLSSARLMRVGVNDLAKMWSEGVLDNLSYLCLLNRLGGRSYSDFSQYFVFPWILSDFNNSGDHKIDRRELGLPMGQIGWKRRSRFDAIYEESEEGYFYGTHYMHLGVVLYFLFRLDPFTIFELYLHHGWNHPNRIFYDITEAWLSAAHISAADVKEMIPQLYFVAEAYRNESEIDLGLKSDVRVGMYDSARSLTSAMNRALQDEATSEHMNEWIDLIFGYKSRGEKAIEAKNMFHPLCYPSENDSAKEQDEVTREAIRAYFVNFVQCSIQLFKKPHPTKAVEQQPRHLMSDATEIVFQRIKVGDGILPPTDIAVVDDRVLVSDRVTAILPPTFKTIIVAYQIALALYAGEYERSQRIIQVVRKGTKIVSSADIFAPSAIAISVDGVFVVVGRCEGGASVFMLRYAGSVVESGTRIGVFETAGPVVAVCVSSAHFIAAAASKNEITVYDIGRRRPLASIAARFEIEKVAVDDEGGLIIGGGKGICVWSVSGEKLAAIEVESEVTALRISRKFVVTGHADGSVSFWRVDAGNDPVLEALRVLKVCRAAIAQIGVDFSCERCVVSTKKEIVEIGFVGTKAKPLKIEFGLECAICGSTVSAKARHCPHCARFICDVCVGLDPAKLSESPHQLQPQPLSSTSARKRACNQCRSALHLEDE